MHLEPLLAWMEDYFVRSGDKSLAGHQVLYGACDGPKQMLMRLP